MGNQLNFTDNRSKLFFEYVRLWKELKPKYLILENVKMRKDIQDAISAILGVQPIEINSALFSGQNRRRLYSSRRNFSFSITFLLFIFLGIIHTSIL